VTLDVFELHRNARRYARDTTHTRPRVQHAGIKRKHLRFESKRMDPLMSLGMVPPFCSGSLGYLRSVEILDILELPSVKFWSRFLSVEILGSLSQVLHSHSVNVRRFADSFDRHADYRFPSVPETASAFDIRVIDDAASSEAIDVPVVRLDLDGS